MNKMIFLRCVSHDPPISSEQVGYNVSSIAMIRHDIANRSQVVATMQALIDTDQKPMYGTYQTNAYWFLHSHPNCDLEIFDEDDCEYPLVEPKSEDLVGVDTVLGRAAYIQRTEKGMIIRLTDLTEAGKNVLRNLGHTNL